MQTYQGAAASPGLVMGPVRRLQHSGPGLERVVLTPGREQALLNAAVVLAKDELRLLEEAAVGTDKDIFLFQQVIDTCVKVAPYLGAWIEIKQGILCRKPSMSHPTWVRGLK